MIAHASTWRLFGSSRESMEVGGSQWKKYKNLEVAVESMEVFFHYFDGSSNYFRGSSNYFDGSFHQLARKNTFFLLVYEENHFKIRDNCRIV